MAGIEPLTLIKHQRTELKLNLIDDSNFLIYLSMVDCLVAEMVDLQKNSEGPRMRWTDHKVRHLIQVVCNVDKEFTKEKWKSVSELMSS